jgi:predicted enzyme related to lactoylglutathione lyase
MFKKGILQMPNFSFVLLYVENPPASAAFYADLLGRPVIDSSPGFAMLPLSDGVMLGLWSRKTVEPIALAQAGASEVAFAVSDATAVNATFADWKRRGLKMIQEPVQMNFGHTFVATDPDGHRLRVYAPMAA